MWLNIITKGPYSEDIVELYEITKDYMMIFCNSDVG